MMRAPFATVIVRQQFHDDCHYYNSVKNVLPFLAFQKNCNLPLICATHSLKLLFSGTTLMDNLWQDLRYSARMLLKQPGFTLIAVLTLSLRIGANTAIFSVINAVLLRPLPYKDPQQLVWVTEVQAQGAQAMFSPAEFLDYQTQNQSFSEMAAYRPVSLTLTGAGEPEQLDGLIVSAAHFSLLGAQADHGGTFQPRDGEAGAPLIAVISHNFWQNRFGGDVTLIGKALSLSGESVIVVGVMPS